jgi:hypothetical protein
MYKPKENKAEFFKSRKNQKKADMVEETVEAVEEKGE